MLRVAMPPGRIADFERVLAPGFEEATGATIETLGMRSSDQVARLRIEKDNASMDVLWIDFGEAQLLARESLLAKVDESDLPNLREVRDEARSPAGIAPITFSSALGFLYNEERLPEPPSSWAELWAPHLRGELALFDFGSTLGPVFLAMAARTGGGGESDIEPGFEKLRELSEHAVVFQSSGPANNLMVAQGEAGLTFGLASPNPRPRVERRAGRVARSRRRCHRAAARFPNRRGCEGARARARLRQLRARRRDTNPPRGRAPARRHQQERHAVAGDEGARTTRQYYLPGLRDHWSRARRMDGSLQP